MRKVGTSVPKSDNDSIDARLKIKMGFSSQIVHSLEEELVKMHLRMRLRVSTADSEQDSELLSSRRAMHLISNEIVSEYPGSWGNLLRRMIQIDSVATKKAE